jgi:hypothetical protein
MVLLRVNKVIETLKSPTRKILLLVLVGAIIIGISLSNKKEIPVEELPKVKESPTAEIPHGDDTISHTVGDVVETFPGQHTSPTAINNDESTD